MRYSSRQSARVTAFRSPRSRAPSSGAQRGSWNTNRSRQTLVSMTMGCAEVGIMLDLVALRMFMLLVLSPAKSLDLDTPSPTAEHTLPDFTKRAAQLIG